MSPRPTLSILVRLLALAAPMLLLPACTSQDKHTFDSTVDRPTNVLLTDPHTRTTLWRMDIPVGHRLVLDLDREGENEHGSISGLPATRLTWRLYQHGQDDPLDREVLQLPGTPLLLRVEYRPVPEYPDGKPPQPLTQSKAMGGTPNPSQPVE